MCTLYVYVYLYFVWSILLFLFQTFAFRNVYVVKKWMWKCLQFPFILQPQGGRCQVQLAPWLVARRLAGIDRALVHSVSNFSVAAYFCAWERCFPFTYHASCMCHAVIGSVAIFRVDFVTSASVISYTVLWLAHSACVDGAIIVYANQVSWRLIGQFEAVLPHSVRGKLITFCVESGPSKSWF